ncbi:NAD(P)/FAD-dependent oxidoreductase [Caproiciproducens galactitolivorans]|uniref:L-2-hydroxyglutarate oxidase LhgO n=1 Tax=Caproiciproducens galactitolivorans TaxID=642589 RepID=A0A4Z0YI63_9FIRM|nr:NAD(P)/FAD-dependent oxidoreductase [Caproiciproducens galactitolivorans]QEY35588.1 NAD(P)/FAD-dependent oxidoreductase [Caproiciproducens galactitolivorans]TGJ77316.1 L-2-hydroxyglutarate oxidase LhgO [Caproiciproducens galactitolivorans]
MMDVIIIGGGVVGCGVARELSRYKLNIALLEKTDDISNGQSKANTAIIHGGYDAKPGTLKAKFNVLGNKMYDKVCEELDVPHKRNTSLVVSFGPDGHAELEKLLQQGIENGVPGLSIIGQDELRRREPNIGSTAYEALLVETGGIVCPYEMTQAYAENAAMNGVTFYRQAEVTGIEKVEGGWKVISKAGTFTAKAVVNCAGLYSDVINNMVSEDKISIVPRRGEYYIVDKKYADAFHASIFQLPTKMGKGILVTPTVDGTVLLGPTAEDIDDKTDTRTTAEGLAKVLKFASLTWEHIPMRNFITTYSGLRAHCDRNDFVLGEAPDAPMFFNAAGVESPGLTSAPAIAQYLAEMIADKLSANKNENFNPIRKGIPKFREMNDEQRARAISINPDYAKVVCRCETVTEAEIREAIRRPVGARSVDGVKRRTRAGMGRCQAGFCTPRTVEILCEELHISPLEVTKFGGNSKYIESYLFEKGDNENA